MLGKKLGDRGITPDLERPELREGPSVEISGPEPISGVLGTAAGLPNKRDVHAEIAVNGGTVEAEVDTERDGCPGRILGGAVKASLQRL